MVTRSVYPRAAAGVIEACRSTGDSRSLRLRILEVIRRAVPFDAYAWLMTDPVTSVGSAPLADAPCLSELPNLIRLKYLTEVNRWTTLGDPPVARLQDATGGELARSRVWRELLHRYDVTDIASTVFRDRYGCWSFLDLWRAGSSGPFTAADADFLAQAAAPVTEALRRSQAETFVVPATAGRHRIDPLVLLLSPELVVRALTSETPAYLRALVPPEGGRAPVPAAAYNVAAQLGAVEAGVDMSAPMARVHVADGLWVTLRAARIGESGEGTGEDVAVTIEQSSPAERAAVFSRTFGLSGRETELLGFLGQGSGTRGIARQMFVSENTVQDHLKSIFAKTGEHSRPRLVSRAFGS